MANAQQIVLNKPEPMRRRNLFSVSFSPVRKRRSARHFVPAYVIPCEPVLRQFNCALRGFSEVRQYQLSFSPKLMELKPLVGPGKLKYIHIDRIHYLVYRAGRLAFEIYTVGLKSYFMEFNERDFPSVVQHFQTLHFPAAEFLTFTAEKVDATPFQIQWTHGKMSTYDYLMRLNLISGRSFKDDSFYPVMPPVLSDSERSSSVVQKYSNVKLPAIVKRPDRDFSLAVYTSNFVPAEFFFDPTVFQRDFPIPPWAPSPLEFVYFNRKLLESPQISKIVSEWVDAVFGSKSTTTPFSTPLLLKDRARRLPPPKEALSCILRIGYGIQTCTLLSQTPDLSVLCLLADDGSVLFLELQFAGDKVTSEIDNVGSVDTDVTNYFSSGLDRLLVYSHAESRLRLINQDKSFSDFPFYSETPLFVGFSDVVIFCPDRFTIAKWVFRSGVPLVTPICGVGVEVSLLVGSPTFQIVAFATTDGFVHIRDAGNGYALGCHDCKDEIRELLITQRWGFVLAFSSDAIYVFSVNGAFVKMYRFGVAIVRVFAHAGFSGFDFVSMTTAGGEILVFEPLAPQKTLSLASGQTDVAKIFFDMHRRHFLIMSWHGIITFCPVFEAYAA
jgi:hypothetical protein